MAAQATQDLGDSIASQAPDQAYENVWRREPYSTFSTLQALLGVLQHDELALFFKQQASDPTKSSFLLATARDRLCAVRGVPDGLMCSGFSLAVYDEMISHGQNVQDVKMLDTPGHSLMSLKIDATRTVVIDSSFSKCIWLKAGSSGSVGKGDNDTLHWNEGVSLPNPHGPTLLFADGSPRQYATKNNANPEPLRTVMTRPEFTTRNLERTVKLGREKKGVIVATLGHLVDDGQCTSHTMVRLNLKTAEARISFPRAPDHEDGEGKKFEELAYRFDCDSEADRVDAVTSFNNALLAVPEFSTTLAKSMTTLVENMVHYRYSYDRQDAGDEKLKIGGDKLIPKRRTRNRRFGGGDTSNGCTPSLAVSCSWGSESSSQRPTDLCGPRNASRRVVGRNISQETHNPDLTLDRRFERILLRIQRGGWNVGTFLAKLLAFPTHAAMSRSPRHAQLVSAFLRGATNQQVSADHIAELMYASNDSVPGPRTKRRDDDPATRMARHRLSEWAIRKVEGYQRRDDLGFSPRVLTRQGRAAAGAKERCLAAAALQTTLRENLRPSPQNPTPYATHLSRSVPPGSGRNRKDPLVIIVITFFMLMYARNLHFAVFRKIAGIWLFANNASASIFSVLSRIGLSSSYTTVLKTLRALSASAQQGGGMVMPRGGATPAMVMGKDASNAPK
ncbi:hypothetical protein GGX14DRAFT_540715 [Mycena pura]|uniref:Uncharacterized protein n=1 Tax=Mycena pura TaxID=153505 RepID=A0AAD6YHL9_9AGAR|nr:hypothetical protein GGX14DRAFT_540715 [Mycena pura]